MAGLDFNVNNVVLGEDFPSRLEQVLALPANRYANDWRSRTGPLPVVLSAGASYEQRISQLMSAGLTIWESWKVKGPSGITESSTHEATRHVPRESLELFEGSRDCYVVLKATADLGSPANGLAITVSLNNGQGRVSVEAPREMLSALSEDVRELMRDYTVPEAQGETPAPKPFKVFIAYGGGRAWEVVRDYLQTAGFQVDAFTEQERAGELTLDVVEEMIRSASVAVIVMTGADKMEGGAIHARQNVVHETGFAQGAIGRRNTVILREAGVTLPTNVDGLTYIQFERGEVHTTKDRVVALVNRLKTLA